MRLASLCPLALAFTAAAAAALPKSALRALADALDDESAAGDPCNPSQCAATFTSYGRPVKLQCSLASGEVSNQLPFSFPGNYELCRTFDFAGAHFCTVNTDVIVLPIVDAQKQLTGDGFPLGSLHLGRCLSKKCTSDMLRKRFFLGLHRMEASLYFETHSQFLPYLESRIRNGTSIRCQDEDREENGKAGESLGATTWIFFSFPLLFVVAGVTFYDALIKMGVITLKKKPHDFLITFSAIRNLESLTAPMKGDFVALNGVRVISMFWIIYGHTVLYSSGVLFRDEPVANPSSTDWQIKNLIMTLPRGAEYSVDTFFFLSGFLAMWGMIQDFSKPHAEGFTPGSYMRMITLRYLRLAPVYIFVLVFYYKVFPLLGDGPYYFSNNGKLRRNEECDDSWWTNVFFINNLYPSKRGGLQGCMPWSWYLANDQQFFLLVPPLAALYLRSRPTLSAEAPWRRVLVLLLPYIILVAFQIGMTIWTMNEYDIKGSFDLNFNIHLYVKPWCRVAPYAIGMGLAVFYVEMDKTNEELGFSPKAWQKKIFLGGPHDLGAHLFALAAFGVTLAIVFGLYNNFKCQAEPATDCNIWLSIALYGVLAAPNWNHATMVAYYSLTYAAWGFALAVLALYAFSGRASALTRFLSHPIFTPLARLTYNAYLVHIMWMIWTYTRVTTPLYVSVYRQVLDSIAFVVLAYASALVLYVWVEKPAMRFLPWIFCMDRPKSHAVETAAAGALERPHSVGPLERELSTVADVESEVLIMSSPERRRHAAAIPDYQRPLLDG